MTEPQTDKMTKPKVRKKGTKIKQSNNEELN